jgi:hypothetical protein
MPGDARRVPLLILWLRPRHPQAWHRKHILSDSPAKGTEPRLPRRLDQCEREPLLCRPAPRAVDTGKGVWSFHVVSRPLTSYNLGAISAAGDISDDQCPGEISCAVKA